MVRTWPAQRHPPAAHVPRRGRAPRAAAHGRSVGPAAGDHAARAARPARGRARGAAPAGLRSGAAARAVRAGAAGRPEVLAGLGAIDFGSDEADVLVIDDRFAPALGELLGRVLL